MAEQYTKNTIISIYRFDSLSNYNKWLLQKANSGLDALAIVKDDTMDTPKGYDIFVNGHSITRTKFFIDDGSGTYKSVTSDDFQGGQYSVVSVSRGGFGETRQVVLKKFNINDYTNEINKIITSYMQDNFNEYMRKFIADISYKPGQGTTSDDFINNFDFSNYAKKADVEYPLTKVHYILRKIYSLIIKKHIKETTETFSFHLIGTDPSTGESVNMNEPHTCYTDSWEITGFMIDEFKKIGTADVSIYGFDVVQGTNTNNNGRILFSIENDDIEAGKVYNFSDFDTEPVKIVPEADNEFTGILYYKKASQDEAIYNPANYDSSISTLLDNPWINDTTKIHVSVPLNQYVEPLKPRYFFCYIPAEYNQPEAEFSKYMANENVEYFISNIEPIVKVASTSTTYPKNTTFNIKKDGFIYCIKPYDSKVPMYAINDTGAYTMEEISKMNYNINGEEIPYVLYRSTYALDTTNIDINVKFK